MAYVEGEARGQHTLFPTKLDELIPEDHVCRVLEAFVKAGRGGDWGLSVPSRRKRGARVRIHATC
jgi:hypothetical protein